MAEDFTPADRDAQEAVRDLRQRFDAPDELTLDRMLREARTHYGWQDKPVDDVLLRKVYDLAKWGATSFNQQPLRIVFVKSQSAKERLKPALIEQNVDKTMSAPVTAIFGHDLRFYERLPETFPVADVKGLFEDNADLAQENAFRNGSLQAAYFMLAARACGLDCGPMSGFDQSKVNEAFFGGTSIRSNFLCNLGYGDESRVFRRLPRLDFDTVAEIA